MLRLLSLASLRMGLVMARDTKCSSVRHGEAEVGMDCKRLDVMSVQPSAPITAILAGKVVSLKHRSSPKAVFEAVAVLLRRRSCAPLPVMVFRSHYGRAGFPRHCPRTLHVRRMGCAESGPGWLVAGLEPTPNATPTIRQRVCASRDQFFDALLLHPIGRGKAVVLSPFANQPPATPNLFCDAKGGFTENGIVLAKKLLRQDVGKSFLAHISRILPQNAKYGNAMHYIAVTA